MQIPAAQFIESAADSIKSLDAFVAAGQTKELASFGAVRAKALGASGLSDDFVLGYQLGLQTARVVIATSGALIVKGVNPKDVL